MVRMTKNWAYRRDTRCLFYLFFGEREQRDNFRKPFFLRIFFSSAHNDRASF